MQPFKAQCNEVARKEFTRAGWDKKRNKRRITTVKAKLCEEQIWFEPSLKPGIFVGKCKHETHNPVYRKV